MSPDDPIGEELAFVHENILKRCGVGGRYEVQPLDGYPFCGYVAFRHRPEGGSNMAMFFMGRHPLHYATYESPDMAVRQRGVRS